VPLADTLSASRPIAVSRNCVTNSSIWCAHGRMAAALTHELTQPLTAVINSLMQQSGFWYR
jgi:C4-dicarboxylate-specific signal transduction histidine kinase